MGITHIKTVQLTELPNELGQIISYNVICATSEDLDQHVYRALFGQPRIKKKLKTDIEESDQTASMRRLV